MRARRRARLELHAADQRAVTIATMVKVGVGTAFCALLTLVVWSAPEPGREGGMAPAAQSAASPLGAAADRKRIFDERRERFQAAYAERNGVLATRSEGRTTSR